MIEQWQLWYQTWYQARTGVIVYKANQSTLIFAEASLYLSRQTEEWLYALPIEHVDNTKAMRNSWIILESAVVRFSSVIVISAANHRIYSSWSDRHGRTMNTISSQRKNVSLYTCLQTWLMLLVAGDMLERSWYDANDVNETTSHIGFPTALIVED